MELQTKLGIYVIALSLFYGSLGIILFFDRGLLAFSNLLFLVGFLTAMGLRASAAFYLSPSRLPQTAAFFAGISLLLMGWTFSGFFIEIFGFVFLYKIFLPQAKSFVANMPVIGTLITFLRFFRASRG